MWAKFRTCDWKLICCHFETTVIFSASPPLLTPQGPQHQPNLRALYSILLLHKELTEFVSSFLGMSRTSHVHDHIWYLLCIEGTLITTQYRALRRMPLKEAAVCHSCKLCVCVWCVDYCSCWWMHLLTVNVLWLSSFWLEAWLLPPALWLSQELGAQSFVSTASRHVHWYPSSEDSIHVL